MTDSTKQQLWEDEEDYDSDEGEETFGLTPKAEEEEVEEQKQPNRQEEEPQVSSFDRSDKPARDDRNDRGYDNNRDRPQRNYRDREQREDRGPRNDRQPRQNREPREKREFKFNPNSNFRLYYLNDPQFYEVVIRKEEAPYEFKIHLFLDGPKDENRNNRDIGCMLLEKLNEYGAKNFRDQMIWGNSEKNNDKIRYTFVIEDTQEAVKCYRFFVQYSKNQKNYKAKKQQEEDPDFNLKEQLMIYLQKEEDVFERYGDEEAELYNMMQKMEEQQRAARKEEDPTGEQRDGGSKKDFRKKNDKFGKTSKREAEDLGINFQRGGPPRFKNDKKKEEDKKEKEVKANQEEQAPEKEAEQTQEPKEQPLGANSNYQIRNDRSDRGDRGDRGSRGGRGGRGRGDRGDRGDRRGGRGGDREDRGGRGRGGRGGDREDREVREGNSDRGRVYQRKRGGDGPQGGDRDDQNENQVYRQKASEQNEDNKGEEAYTIEGKEEQKQSSRGAYKQRGDRGGYRSRGGDGDRQYQKKNYDQEDRRDNKGDRKRGGLDSQMVRSQYKEKTQHQDGDKKLYTKKKQYNDQEKAEYKKRKPQGQDQKKPFAKADQPSNKQEKVKTNRFAGMEDFE